MPTKSAKSVPKFNPAVMIVLGLVVGMFSYYLWQSFSRAGLLCSQSCPDLVIEYTSYSHASNVTIAGENIWYILSGSPVKFYAYSRNIGPVSQLADYGFTSGQYVNNAYFCIDVAPDLCRAGAQNPFSTAVSYYAKARVRALGANDQVFAASPSPWVAQRGSHVLTVCMVVSGSAGGIVVGTEDIENNCTSMDIEVLDASTAGVLGTAQNAQCVLNIIINPAGCQPNTDGYGLDSYNNAVFTVTNNVRPFCYGPPREQICHQAKI